MAKRGRSIKISFKEPGSGLAFINSFAAMHGLPPVSPVCPCGITLPQHLLDVGLQKHTCSCGNVFNVVEREFVQVVPA